MKELSSWLCDGLTEEAYDAVSASTSASIAVEIMLYKPTCHTCSLMQQVILPVLCIFWQLQPHLLMFCDVWCCPGATGCLLVPPGRAMAANTQDPTAVMVSTISKRALVKAALLLQRELKMQTLLAMLVSLTHF